MMKLKSYFHKNTLEAGCDEAGRGCLAGPVVAAAVILKPKFNCNLLNDSKLVTKKNREILREIIQNEAIAFAVASVDVRKIEEINILNASILAMHLALEKLHLQPQHIIVDGNRFLDYQNIKHECIIKGDSKYQSIAAASILAKCYRDDIMQNLHEQTPHYDWFSNMGYPTKKHRQAILEFGPCDHHRKTFKLLGDLEEVDFN